MSEARRKCDPEFREGAVGIVIETGRPVAEVAREIGINEGTLWNWVRRHRKAIAGTSGVSESEQAELVRLRREFMSWACSVMSVKTVAKSMARLGLVGKKRRVTRLLTRADAQAPKFGTY